MSALAVLWFFLIFVLIAGYFVLDGFDLGVGVLYRALAKTDAERALVRRSIGPVWDGNEVWLLTAGGALFAAFPAAYATTFSGFYLAVMLVLFGLIVRAVSLEFGAHDPKWGRAWDACFTIGSFLPALLLGVALGNVIAGVPLAANGDYAVRNERQRTLFTNHHQFRIMGRFIIKLVRLILKYGRFSLVCVVIQLNGNSKYIEYMNNDFKEEKPCLEKEEP